VIRFIEGAPAAIGKSVSIAGANRPAAPASLIKFVFGCQQRLSKPFPTTIGRRATFAVFAAFGLIATDVTTLSAPASDDPFYQSTDGIAIHIGLTPASAVKPKSTPHAVPMHGGPPVGLGAYHLTVEVFDAASRQSISNAIVSVATSGPPDVTKKTALEPMELEDITSYGAFVFFPTVARYIIHVDVTRPGSAPVSFNFPFDHNPP
jgi:hypothetical protein